MKTVLNQFKETMAKANPTREIISGEIGQILLQIGHEIIVSTYAQGTKTHQKPLRSNVGIQCILYTHSARNTERIIKTY